MMTNLMLILIAYLCTVQSNASEDVIAKWLYMISSVALMLTLVIRLLGEM